MGIDARRKKAPDAALWNSSKIVESNGRARFFIGPSGWSYPDWAGVFYPARKPAGFKPLAFIARVFNAVEVNSSFYALPTHRMTAGWPGQTPSDFRFAFKLTRDFTHDRTAFPPAAAVAAFHEGVRPVRDAGRLGPLLLQFPWSFRYTPAACDRLAQLAEAFAGFDRFVEVRHTSWAQPDALDVLRSAGGYCNIDQPVLRDCLRPTEHVFGRKAYVRLHGRNAASWFAENRPSFERYNYLYAESEIAEWVARLNRIGSQADETYVFANNHYRGQAPANALELRSLLEGRRVEVPPELLAAYPRLAHVALPPRQRELFGQTSR